MWLLLRAQRLFHADLARTLLHRNQHDVHQPDAADAERQRANESQQDFERRSHDRELVKVLLEIGDEDSALIIGAEVVMPGEHAAHHARELLMIPPVIIHKNSGDVLRIVEVAHGAEGDDDHAVVVVVAALHLVLVNANHLKTDAGDTDALSQSWFTREEPPLGLVTDHGHAGMLHLILFVQAATGGHVEAANALEDGIDAVEEQVGEGAASC